MAHKIAYTRLKYAEEAIDINDPKDCKQVCDLIAGKSAQNLVDLLTGKADKNDSETVIKALTDVAVEIRHGGQKFPKTKSKFIIKYLSNQNGLYSLDFFHTEKRNGVWTNFNFSISADWSHGINRYTGQKQEVSPRAWQWNTGDRLEAEKAIAVIEHYKNDRLTTIENLKASKKKYAAYLRLARKAEAIMKEMEGYDYEIREFAKEKALSQYSHHSYFWKGY